MIHRRNLARHLADAAREPGRVLPVLIRRTRLWLAYRASDGRSPRLKELTLVLTRRCNLRCYMCGQWGETGTAFALPKSALTSEMSADEIGRLLDDVASWAPSVTLFGGEPTLHRSFADVLRRVKGRGLHCTVISNGTTLERLADTMVEAGLDQLVLSIDGSAAIHDEIRGVPGGFHGLARGAERLRGAMVARGVRKPVVRVNCTINARNAGAIREIVPAIRDAIRPDALNLHHLIFVTKDGFEQEQRRFAEVFGGSVEGWGGFVSREHEQIDVERLVEDLAWATGQDHGFEVRAQPNLSPDEVRRYYRVPDFVSRTYPPRCLSPWMKAYVYPDGEVRPCLDCSVPLGSVREQSFREIWNTEAFRRFRQELKRVGMFAVCTRCPELYRH